MIKINTAPAAAQTIQPAPLKQSAKDDGGSFASMLKATTDKANSDSTPKMEKSDPNNGNDGKNDMKAAKDSHDVQNTHDKQDKPDAADKDSGQASAAAQQGQNNTNPAALAAASQAANTQQTVIQQPAVSAGQSVSAAQNVQQILSVSAAANTVQASAVNEVGMQKNVQFQSAVQTAQTNAMPNQQAASEASAQQGQSLPEMNRAVQKESSAQPMQAVQTAQPVTEQADQTPKTQENAVQTALPNTQAGESQQQAQVSANSAKEVFGRLSNQSVQNPQNAAAEKTDQPALPVTVKTVNAAEEKHTDAQTSQQNPNGLNDLYHSGKVVIPVSDESSNVQKPAAGQLTDSITANLRSGKQEFQLDLYPKDLGRVTVKLASENGVLTIEIAASNPKTQSMLLSSSGDIQSILQSSQNQQIHVVDASHNRQLYDQQQNNQQAGQQQQQQQQENRHQPQSHSQKDDGSITTVDFLSVMQQLKMNAKY